MDQNAEISHTNHILPRHSEIMRLTFKTQLKQKPLKFHKAMRNKVNYIHITNFINLFHTFQDQEETKKIRQNPEKGCYSL